MRPYSKLEICFVSFYKKYFANIQRTKRYLLTAPRTLCCLVKVGWWLQAERLVWTGPRAAPRTAAGESEESGDCSLQPPDLAAMLDRARKLLY